MPLTGRGACMGELCLSQAVELGKIMGSRDFFVSGASASAVRALLFGLWVSNRQK